MQAPAPWSRTTTPSHKGPVVIHHTECLKTLNLAAGTTSSETTASRAWHAVAVRSLPATPRAYTDERAESLAHLEFVIPEFEAMGTRPALEQARRLREVEQA